MKRQSPAARRCQSEYNYEFLRRAEISFFTRDVYESDKGMIKMNSEFFDALDSSKRKGIAKEYMPNALSGVVALINVKWAGSNVMERCSTRSRTFTCISYDGSRNKRPTSESARRSAQAHRHAELEHGRSKMKPEEFPQTFASTAEAGIIQVIREAERGM